MKKKLFLLPIFLCLTIMLNAQVIEVIDAIAGKLLPKITESVKDIIGSNVKKQKQAEVEKEVITSIKKAKEEILGSLDNEISNIDNINQIHTLSRKMALSVGQLRVLSEKNFIASLKDASSVRKEVAILFVQNINDILETRSKLDAIKITSNSAELRNNLKTLTENMDKSLLRLKTALQFSGNSITYNSKDVDNYIEAIDRSYQTISDLAIAIDNTSRLIESYLETYSLSFKNLKNSVNK